MTRLVTKFPSTSSFTLSSLLLLLLLLRSDELTDKRGMSTLVLMMPSSSDAGPTSVDKSGRDLRTLHCVVGAGADPPAAVGLIFFLLSPRRLAIPRDWARVASAPPRSMTREVVDAPLPATLAQSRGMAIPRDWARVASA